MPRKSADAIDRYLSAEGCALYLPTRTVSLYGSIDKDMARSACKALYLLRTHDSEKDITIQLSTDGGDDSACAAIFDAILACEHGHVTIVGTGEVSSSGTIIMQAADTRVLTPRAEFMIHYGTVNAPESTPKSARAYLDSAERYIQWMEQLYLGKIREKHPRYTMRRLRDLLDKDTYFTPQEALDLGLIDRIGYQ